jgi:hypothetical protein
VRLRHMTKFKRPRGHQSIGYGALIGPNIYPDKRNSSLEPDRTKIYYG